jgi:outer membrane protein assembly factor BamA
MRIQVTVEEWPQLRVRYGFTVEEQRPAEEVRGRDLVPGLSADVTRRTLFGRAIALVGAVEYQRRKELGRGILNAPTFMGLPIESSFIVERSREDFADATLITDRSGISWEQRFRFTPRLRLSYSYNFEKNHTFDTKPSLDAFAPAFDITVNIARLTGTAAYDTRDNVSDTSRGWLLSSSFDYAPENGGSDIRFVRGLGRAYYFRPWRGAVLASAAQLGLAAALGGQDLIPSERFFAGGAGTVRGVGEDRLGPRDFLGDPTGGQGLLVFNQEIRFPLYRWFRGVAFADAGNVFTRASDIRLGGLSGALGVGLRLVTRFPILRVDYGRLVSPVTRQERSGVWILGIGQAF